MSQPVYELSDMQDRPIEGQFYNYELVKVTVSLQTEFQERKKIKYYENVTRPY